jgi:hypothetical protein
MKSTVLLNTSENTKQIEEEEKTRFVRNILETMGLPIEEIWDEDNYLSIDNKIKLRSILTTYNIQIIDDSDGGLQIFCDGEVIGRWNKCEYILKKDLKQKDPSKKLYLEMKIANWSIFEDVENNA